MSIQVWTYLWRSVAWTGLLLRTVAKVPEPILWDVGAFGGASTAFAARAAMQRFSVTRAKVARWSKKDGRFDGGSVIPAPPGGCGKGYGSSGGPDGGSFGQSVGRRPVWLDCSSRFSMRDSCRGQRRPQRRTRTASEATSDPGRTLCTGKRTVNMAQNPLVFGHSASRALDEPLRRPFPTTRGWLASDVGGGVCRWPARLCVDAAAVLYICRPNELLVVSVSRTDGRSDHVYGRVIGHALPDTVFADRRPHGSAADSRIIELSMPQSAVVGGIPLGHSCDCQRQDFVGPALCL